MARKAGSKQVLPTYGDVKECYQLLREKAAEGDTNAAYYLICLSQHKKPLGLQTRGND